MIYRKLTEQCGIAKRFSRGSNFRGYHTMSQPWARAGWKMAGAIALVGSIGGCINVAAPDKPIVIELNINIRQEVVFALAEDAANTVEENADIF